LFFNYNYKSLQIRLNHAVKHCNFHYKTLWIATVFPTWIFFLFLVFVLLFFFLKLSMSIFFNIKLIENLALHFFFLLTEKLNHVVKALYLSSQNTVDYHKSFCLISKFLITNTTFFSSWNICFIISLFSIIYLVLVHNYNTVKCICFISSR
jgi:hypothetical protein